ncbi:MAG: SpoIVB peptidase [Clostridia bacterium]|nr:SpoIVB peptidase [Clostridia bacterium]
MMFKRLYAFICSVSLLTMGICGAAAYLSPSEMTVSSDSGIFCCEFPLSVRYDDIGASAELSSCAAAEGEIMLFGSIPVKPVNIEFSERQNVKLGGEPFGIRIYTDGLVVSELSSVPTAEGRKNPSAEAGISCGDTITSVNGIRLRTNEQLTEAVQKSQGKSISIEAVRNGETYMTSITPAMDSQLKSWRIGLWVRDSCAGIGTVTFTDPETDTFAGLGHGICDNPRGSIMPLYEGDIVPAVITSVDKSTGGCPGSLCGSFSDNKAIGTIYANDNCGLYGKILSDFGSGAIIPIAFRQEVVRGKAQIRTTISGDTPEYYDIEIEDISYNNNNVTKNMIIKVTDERLLDLTGGIVQGMSGSPIIQNGRLAGAVTHVFINDPTHGYAIFSENMAAYNNCIIQKHTE